MKVIKLNESTVNRLVDTTCNKCGSKVKINVDFEGTSYKQKPDITCFRCPECGEVSDYINESISECNDFKIYGDEGTLRQLERDLQESVNYPNGKEVSNDDVNLDIALDYMFGEDRDPNNDNYTDDEKQRAINYWIEKTDSPFPGWKDKKKSINEDTYYRTPKEWVIDGKESLVGYEYINKYTGDTYFKDLDDNKYDSFANFVRSLNEDVSKEWKPNTSFKHIKDIYNKVKANNYKYVNNEREEFMAAVRKADNKGYKPNECRQIKDWHKDIWSHNRNINENLSESKFIKEDIEHNNKLVIEVKSGISADGFNCTIYDSTDKVVYKREYSYGYNASYSKDWADTNTPYVADIINDLCAKYSINKNDIKIVAGKNTFKNVSVSTDDVEKFKRDYLNEDVINEDQYGRYSDTFKKIIREYTDSALIVGLVDDIVRYAKEADLRDLYFEKGYDKLKDDELIESINEKDILNKLDQFKSQITVNKDDEKALKDILLKKNISFKIDDSKANKLTFKLNYKKLDEDLTDVATATLEGPEDGPQFGLTSLLNIAIQKELETVDEYNTLALNAKSEGYEDIANVINEINTEENKHIGQLQELLKTVSPNAEAIDVGKVEGEQQLEEDVLNKPQENDNTNNNKLVEDDNVDWKPIYDKFKQVEKDLNNDGEAVTAIIDKMYQDNKDDPAYQKAYQMWSDGEEV